MTTQTLPETGFVRLKTVLTFIPVSKSTLYAGIKAGRYPRPTRALGLRITAWRAEDIRAYIEMSAAKLTA